MKIGFIGLGIMGKPMAKNLIRKGYNLVVFDVNEGSVRELVEFGAESAESSAEVAKRTELIITMLPNSPHVKSAILGENGVVDGIREGSIVIDMSSIAPNTSKEIYKVLKEKGVEILDAPVSGGEPKAIDGTLSVMVGGDEDTFNKVKEVLLAMSGSVVRCGEIGAGNVTKLANQVIVALNIAALSEALVLGTKAGVDPSAIYNAIRGGLAGSTVMDAKAPMMIQGNFNPGFRIDLHIKDLANALETGHEVGAPLPLTASIMEILQNLKSDNLSKNDHSAIVKYYEKLANITVQK